MEDEGLKSLVSLQEMSVVGFWEVAKRYGFFKKIIENCNQILTSEHFDAFIPVDYPGFNLRLATFAKLQKIPVFYYIAPQLWAWGKNRAGKLKDSVDELLVVFPFEVEFFGKLGIYTTFVGHPLLDAPQFIGNFPNLADREKKIAFLPGSRKQEIQRNLPLMLKTAEMLSKNLTDYEFVVAVAPNVDKNLYVCTKSKNLQIKFAENSVDLMKKSAAGLIKTGTSTLESVLCGLPFAMMYKTSSVSYLLAKNLINLTSISLVNIISRKEIVREFIQHEATPERMADEILRLVKDTNVAEKMQEEFRKIRRELGEAGASERAANVIAERLR